MSEYLTGLKVGDKVKAEQASKGYYGVALGEIITVTEVDSDGRGFNAVRADGTKVQGCTASKNYWTFAEAKIETPVESWKPVGAHDDLETGAVVRLNQDYSDRKKGLIGRITNPRAGSGSRDYSLGYLVSFESKDGTAFQVYQGRLDVLEATSAPVTAAAKAAKKWTAKPLSRNSKLYKTATSPALRKVSTIRKLRKKGVSVRTIAKKLGLSKSAVGRVIQRITA